MTDPDGGISMAIDPLHSWNLTPGVLFVNSTHGAWLLDFDRGFYALDAVGANAVGRALRDGPGSAAAALAEAYGVPETEAASDLAALREDLATLGLLGCRRGGPGAPRRLFAAAVAAALPLALALWPKRPGLAVWLLLALAWTAIRLEGYASALRRWRLSVPSAGRISTANPNPARVGRHVRRVSCSYLLPPCACKERALTADFLLRSVFGLPSEVVVAVRPTPFTVHTWAEHDGRVVGDDPRQSARFRRVGVLDPNLRPEAERLMPCTN
jgi:Transglutaminase-like superfamily